MNREPFRHDWDASRQQISQPQTVGKTTESVQPDMGHQPFSAGLHLQPGRGGSVQLASALLDWTSELSTSSESQARRALSRIPAPQVTDPRE